MNKKAKTTLGISAVIAVAAIVVLSFIISFFAKLPGYGDTFKCKLSDAVFATENEALNAYIDNEINGKTTSARLTGSKTLSKLNAAEVQKLGLENGNFDKIEKTEVSFTIDDKTYTTEIYVCFLENDGYRYFTPPVRTGEMLSASYYNSVVNSSDFENCTLKLQLISSLKIANVPIKSTVNYTMKISDGVAYYRDKASFIGIELSREIYAFDTPEGIRCVWRQSADASVFESMTGESLNDINQDWTVAGLGEVALPFSDNTTRVSEFSLFGLYGGTDHTFYEKTKTGFAVSKFKRDEFTEIAVENGANRLGESSDFENEFIRNLLKQDVYSYDCNYVVKDGRLRRAYLKANCNMKNVDWRKAVGSDPPDWFKNLSAGLSLERSSICDIVDVGTTAFEINPEVRSKIAPYL